MKLGATQFSFDRPNIPLVFEIAREVGFNSVELCVSPDKDGMCPITTVKTKVNALRKSADKNGIALETILGHFWENTLCDARPGRLEKCIEIARQTIEMAGALGATDLLVIPGAVEIPWGKDYQAVP